MTTIKGLLFDLDGTLVNTYEADYLAYRDAIKEVTGITILADDFYRTNGQEMRQKLQTLAPNLPEQKIMDIAASKKRHYPNYVHKTVPNRQLIDFLHTLADHHVVALVTTAKRQNAQLVLQHHGIDHYFKHTVFGDDITHPKPHPESYKRALDLVGLSADEVIAFEDSQTGIDAAAAAGIKVVRIRSFS